MMKIVIKIILRLILYFVYYFHRMCSQASTLAFPVLGSLGLGGPMIRVRVPLEDFRALMFQDSGPTLTRAAALGVARDPAACCAKVPHRGPEASHAR